MFVFFSNEETRLVTIRVVVMTVFAWAASFLSPSNIPGVGRGGSVELCLGYWLQTSYLSAISELWSFPLDSLDDLKNINSTKADRKQHF